MLAAVGKDGGELLCGLTSDTPSIVFDLIPLHANLMRSDDSLQAIALTEPLGNIRAKLESDSAFTRPPTRRGLRISPEHLHHQSFLSRLPLLVPIQIPHIVQGNLIVREEASVQDKILRADEGGEWECAEGFGEEFEGALVVFGFAFTFKTVHTVHVVRLVVSAVQEKVLRVEELVTEEEQRNLSRP